MESRKLRLRALAVTVGIGVAGGLLLIPVNAYAVRIGTVLPLLYAPIMGAWMLPVLTSMLTLRRPLAGIVTGLVAGLVSLPLGWYGFAALVSMIVIGGYLELAVAVTRYRRWGKPVFAVALALWSLLYAAYVWRAVAMDTADLLTQVAFVGLMILSTEGALVLAALAARFLQDSRFLRGLEPRRRPTRSPERLVLD